MNFARIFVDRPIFAGVLSIVITMLGALSYFALPVAQYPEVIPPTVVVSATYPGADARTLAETVSTPLEQEINGVEDMIYISSSSHQRRPRANHRHVRVSAPIWTKRRCSCKTASTPPCRDCRRKCAVSASS
jgi:hypothetical protein